MIKITFTGKVMQGFTATPFRREFKCNITATKPYFSFTFVKSHKPQQSNSQLFARQELDTFSKALASGMSGWQKKAPIHRELTLVNYQHVQGL